MNSNVIDWII